MWRLLSKQKLLLEDVLDDFMTDCKYRDLRRATMKLYEQSLRLFFKFIADDYKIIYLQGIKKEHIQQCIDFTKNSGKYSFVVDEIKLI